MKVWIGSWNEAGSLLDHPCRSLQILSSPPLILDVCLHFALDCDSVREQIGTPDALLLCNQFSRILLDREACGTLMRGSSVKWISSTMTSNRNMSVGRSSLALMIHIALKVRLAYM